MQRIPRSVTTHPLGMTPKDTGVVIILVVIIAVSMIYTLSSLFSSGSPKGSENNELHFECIKCAKQFVIMGEEFSQIIYDQEVIGTHLDRTMGMPDCPHCKEQHTGLLMTQCPKCSEHFLRSKVNIRTAPENYVPPPPICPHCNTDIDKYLTENLKTE